ncbi:MAG: hypothetical protein FWD88_00160 [Treponema sp.]|nr:hypothetical protein [Treponema sp.]
MTVKKTAFCLAVAALLVSCAGYEWPDTVVTNTTGLEITFKFHHTGVISLPGDTPITFRTRPHQTLEWFSYDSDGPQPRRFFTPQPDEASVWFFYSVTNDGIAAGDFRVVHMCTGDGCLGYGCDNPCCEFGDG